MNWISVEDRLPESSRSVLAIQETGYNNNRVIIVGKYARKHELEADEDSWDRAEYSEERDEYFCPEGWYEDQWNWGDYTSIGLSEGRVTHWMPLPSPPELKG